MTLLDVNILIYASDADAPEHPKTFAWLDRLFESPGIIALSWPTLWGFLRISTNRRRGPHPAMSELALRRIEEWLRQPDVRIVQPGTRHLEILGSLIVRYEACGPLVSDAILAALAIEHGATLASTDRDFSRFPNLKWVNPLDEG